MKNKLDTKNIKAMIKRHYQSLNDSHGMGADWTQSLTHSSLRQHTNNKTFTREARRQKINVYRHQSYDKDLATALKMWEFQAPKKEES